MTASGVDRILALDLATRAGWATLDEEGDVVAGRESFEGDLLLALLRLKRFVIEMLQEFAPAVVVIERQFLRGGDSSVRLGAMCRVVQDTCRAQEVICEAISACDAKKFITGNGNATKEQVLNAVRRRGHLVDGYDEADAVAVLLCAADRYGVPVRKVAA